MTKELDVYPCCAILQNNDDVQPWGTYDEDREEDVLYAGGGIVVARRPRMLCVKHSTKGEGIIVIWDQDDG